MYSYEKSYGTLLQESGLESLKERREKQFRKFAEKASENPVYQHLFPKNLPSLNTRNPRLFQEKFARTDRLYKSPLYAMRRLLNKTPDSDRFNSPNLIDLSHVFNDPY